MNKNTRTKNRHTNDERCIVWEHYTPRGEMGSRCGKAEGHRGAHQFVGTYVQPWSRLVIAEAWR